MEFTLTTHDSEEVFARLTKMREKKFSECNKVVEIETVKRDAYMQAIDDVISELIEAIN